MRLRERQVERGRGTPDPRPLERGLRPRCLEGGEIGLAESAVEAAIRGDGGERLEHLDRLERAAAHDDEPPSQELGLAEELRLGRARRAERLARAPGPRPPGPGPRCRAALSRARAERRRRDPPRGGSARPSPRTRHARGDRCVETRAAKRDVGRLALDERIEEGAGGGGATDPGKRARALDRELAQPRGVPLVGVDAGGPLGRSLESATAPATSSWPAAPARATLEPRDARAPTPRARAPTRGPSRARPRRRPRRERRRDGAVRTERALGELLRRAVGLGGALDQRRPLLQERRRARAVGDPRGSERRARPRRREPGRRPPSCAGGGAPGRSRDRAPTTTSCRG